MRLFVLSIVVVFQLMLSATSAQTIPNSSLSDPQLTISTRDNQLAFASER